MFGCLSLKTTRTLKTRHPKSWSHRSVPARCRPSLEGHRLRASERSHALVRPTPALHDTRMHGQSSAVLRCGWLFGVAAIASIASWSSQEDASAEAEGETTGLGEAPSPSPRLVVFSGGTGLFCSTAQQHMSPRKNENQNNARSDALFSPLAVSHSCPRIQFHRAGTQGRHYRCDLRYPECHVRWNSVCLCRCPVMPVSDSGGSSAEIIRT